MCEAAHGLHVMSTASTRVLYCLRLLSFVLQDFKNIEAGVYKLPWDMTTPNHRQYNPVHVLRTAANFVSEASNTLQRRMRGSPDKVWLDSSMYPDYYLNTFHYQVTVYAKLPPCIDCT